MAFILQERVKLINFRSERSIHVVLAFWLFFVISSVSMTSTLIFSEWGRVSRQRNCLYCILYISWPWPSASSTQTWTGHWLSNFERFSFKNPWAIHTDMYTSYSDIRCRQYWTLLQFNRKGEHCFLLVNFLKS